MAVKIWQGSFDMLCGIYCLADILARHGTKATGKDQDYEEFAKAAFLKLMLSVEKCGYLKAKKIASDGTAGGFTDKQLNRVFNEMSASARRGLASIAFSDRKWSKLTNSEWRGFISEGACAVVQEHGEDHWIGVLDYHRDGGYFCFDPQLSDNVCRRERLRWNNGLMVAKSAIFESYNAQTH